VLRALAEGLTELLRQVDDPAPFLGLSATPAVVTARPWPPGTVRSRRGCDHEILDEFMGLFFSSDRKSLNTRRGTPAKPLWSPRQCAVSPPHTSERLCGPILDAQLLIESGNRSQAGLVRDPALQPSAHPIIGEFGLM